jgi:two-component system copper resistance phosphate regulon response regulator CusR
VDEPHPLAYKEKGNPVRILVIEDEQKLGQALKEGLETEHYGVALAYTGEEGFYLVQTESFDLVILDVMLPGRSGLEILRAMRQHGLRTPVLMLTARDAIEDRVRGLDTGADDYLLNPSRSPNCWHACAR